MSRFLEQVAAQILEEAGPAITKETAEFLADGFRAVVHSIRDAVIPPTMVEYAIRLARGVMIGNPTSSPEFLRDLIVEGIRILMQNPNVSWGSDQKMSVNALATLALMQAGYVGPPIPPPES